MRLTAFFKLYKMCTLLHRSKLNILAIHYLVLFICVLNHEPTRRFASSEEGSEKDALDARSVPLSCF